ncbi:unnamed protein product [Rotaria sordida]|uniref:TIR domain-containing protein n=2 Tax=Rotaria sordida TaxID=392033 RepID=A0A814EZ34_9BILA|nr:unnamed protein product [Rotaria sordida]
MPILRSMINDLYEPIASSIQTSNISLFNEDFRISKTSLQSQISEFVLSTEETGDTDNVDASTENTSETIMDAIMSSGKRFSIALSSTDSLVNNQSDEQIISSNTIEPAPSQEVDDLQSQLVLSSVQTTTVTETSTKKQHIMISYNRSCEDTCRQIRNALKELKYEVWMDVYDMHNNFIDGMAKAIRNSYIVLMCINSKYKDSFWCRKEAEDISIKQIKIIPCYMEKPFRTDDWLDFLLGANIRIDFSQADKFHESFNKLVEEINVIEKELDTYSRGSPPATPMNNSSEKIILNPTIETFDTILGNFKTWIEENRESLKQCNRKQSAQLINQLIKVLNSDNSLSNDTNKQEFLKQLLLSTSQNHNNNFTQSINNSIIPDYLMVKGLVCVMGLWAVKIVFQKN